MIESLYKQTSTTTLYSDLNRTKAVTVKYYKPDSSDYAAIIDFIVTGLKPICVNKKELQTLTPFEISRKCLEKFDQALSGNSNEESTDLLTNLFVFNEKGIDYLKTVVSNVFFELDVNRITFNVLVNCMIIILQEGSNTPN